MAHTTSPFALKKISLTLISVLSFTFGTAMAQNKQTIQALNAKVTASQQKAADARKAADDAKKKTETLKKKAQADAKAAGKAKTPKARKVADASMKAFTQAGAAQTTAEENATKLEKEAEQIAEQSDKAKDAIEKPFEEAPTETVEQTIAPIKAPSKASKRGEKEVRRDFGVAFWIWQEVAQGTRQGVTFDLNAQHKDIALSYFWRTPAKFSKLWRHITGVGLLVGQVDAKGGIFDPLEELFQDQLTFGGYYSRGLIMRTSLQTETIFFAQAMIRKTNWNPNETSELEVNDIYPGLIGLGIKLNYDFNFGGSLSFGINYQPQSDTTMWQFDLTI